MQYFLKRLLKSKLVFLLLCVLTNASFSAEIQSHQFMIHQDRATSQIQKKTILFFGNSLTAGFGLDLEQAFPALIQQKIDSLGWHFEVINAGLSGETSAGGVRRINWLLQRKIDILVLELGGNDVLRGITLKITRANLQTIIDKTKNKYPDIKIILAGMQAPPNLGAEYVNRFREIFIELAEENHALLIPFLLEGVGGIPKLNQPNRIHPTAEGHKILADNVWNILKPLLIKIQNQID